MIQNVSQICAIHINKSNYSLLRELSLKLWEDQTVSHFYVSDLLLYSSFPV
jgi:hypothetical protein